MFIDEREIENKNSKGEHHGYQEWYLDNKLWLRVVYKNSEPIGYEDDQRKKETNYYIC